MTSIFHVLIGKVITFANLSMHVRFRADIETTVISKQHMHNLPNFDLACSLLRLKIVVS